VAHAIGGRTSRTLRNYVEPSRLDSSFTHVQSAPLPHRVREAPKDWSQAHDLAAKPEKLAFKLATDGAR
jgi:hypothetical protein